MSTDKNTKLKTCRICRVQRSDFARYARTCEECKSKNLCRCTKCDTVKPIEAFYKNNPYGQCAACKTGQDPSYVRRTSGFSALDPEVQADIIRMLKLRKLYHDTKGKEGQRFYNQEICKKYDIDKSTLSYWIMKGSIKLDDDPVEAPVETPVEPSDE